MSGLDLIFKNNVSIHSIFYSKYSSSHSVTFHHHA